MQPHAMWRSPRPGECEPETPQRIAWCRARKEEQLRRAREAGILPYVPTYEECTLAEQERAKAAGLEV
jgi:hypothetical protein